MTNSRPSRASLVPANPQGVTESAAGIFIGTLTGSDPDGDTVTYGVTDARFRIIGSQLFLADGVTLDYEAARVVRLTVTATDTAGLTRPAVIYVPVLNVNEAPTGIVLSRASVRENLSGRVIGTLGAVDPDRGDSHVFSLSDDRFEISGRQVKLKQGVSLDQESGPVALAVTATDGGGYSVTETLTIQVLDVNERPTDIVLDANQVSGGWQGATVGTLSALDPDLDDHHSFNTKDSRFEVVDGALKLRDGVALSAATTVRVTAIDASGLSVTKILSVGVRANQAPALVLDGDHAVAENAPGAEIGRVIVTDPDAALGDSALITVSDSRFEVSSSGLLKLKPGVSLDFEATPSVTLTLRVTDRAGASAEQTITIGVLNVPEDAAVFLRDSRAISSGAGVSGPQFRATGPLPIDGDPGGAGGLAAATAGPSVIRGGTTTDSSTHHGLTVTGGRGGQGGIGMQADAPPPLEPTATVIGTNPGYGDVVETHWEQGSGFHGAAGGRGGAGGGATALATGLDMTLDLETGPPIPRVFWQAY